MSVELIVLIALAVGIFAGWNIHKLALHWMLRDINKRIEQEQARLEEQVRDAVLTREGDMVYMHDLKTNEFIVQGRDANELQVALNMKNSEFTYRITRQNCIDVGLTKE